MITNNFGTLGNEISFDGKNLTYKSCYPTPFKTWGYSLLYDKDKVISTYSNAEHGYKIPEDVVKDYCIEYETFYKTELHTYPDSKYYRNSTIVYPYEYYDEYKTWWFMNDADYVGDVYNNPNISWHIGDNIKMTWLSPYYCKGENDRYIIHGWFRHI